MKKHYYGTIHNDQGASDTLGHASSIGELVKLARRTLGSGWQVEIHRVDIDGDGHSAMGETIVKTFTIR